MAILPTEAEKNNKQVIYDLLKDLCDNPDKLDGVADLIYKLIWDGY